MDGSVAIETNRVALVRIVATLAAMAGLADRQSGVGSRQSGRTPGQTSVPTPDCRLPTASTITRHLWRTILRLLRPAEAAARRLIIAAARGIVVPPPPRFTRSPSPVNGGGSRSRTAAAPILPCEAGEGDHAQRGGGGIEPRPTPRRIALPLFDPLRRPFRPLRRVPERDLPRICVPGWTVRRPVPPPPPPPSPDDLVSAAGVVRRLASLAGALDDLPRQARRFARLKARLDARDAWDEASAPQTGRLRRFRRLSPLRGGPPPSGRLAVWDPSAPKGKNIREIDVILAHAHALALYALEFPDTS